MLHFEDSRVIHKGSLLMFANANLFHWHNNGHFFLEGLMNQRKVPSTTLSLHITIIMDMIWSHCLGASHHRILFIEKDKALSGDGSCHSPAPSRRWLWLHPDAGFVTRVVAGIDKVFSSSPCPVLLFLKVFSLAVGPSEWNIHTAHL